MSRFGSPKSLVSTKLSFLFKKEKSGLFFPCGQGNNKVCSGSVHDTGVAVNDATAVGVAAGFEQSGDACRYPTERGGQRARSGGAKLPTSEQRARGARTYHTQSTIKSSSTTAVRRYLVQLTIRSREPLQAVHRENIVISSLQQSPGPTDPLLKQSFRFRYPLTQQFTSFLGY